MIMRNFSGAVYLFLLASLLLILLAACSGIESGRKIAPVSLQVSDRLILPFSVQKALLDTRSGTLYLLEKDRPNIRLYRNGQLVNALGGFGSDRSNFQKLSDIALDSDGNLLALDEFTRLVRKYNPEGKWITDIELPGFSQPSRFCATAESDLIVYDAATKELKRISGFDGRMMFSFGRFQVESVSHISANREEIAITSETGGRTVLFSSMGMHLEDYPGQMAVDQFLNRYIFEDGALRLQGQDIILPLGWQDAEVKLFPSQRAMILVKDTTVLTITPIYGNR
jgi:hypothetical protein